MNAMLAVDTMLSKEYLNIANSPMMWIMVIPTMIIVCAQALLFMQGATKAGHLVDLSKKDLKEAVRAGAICSIGSGLSMFIVMIAMMSILGGPFSWLRLSIIGTITTEMLGATAGANAMGVDLGSANYGIIAFTASVWVITLNTWGFFIVNLLFAHKMEKFKVSIKKRDIYMFNAIGSCVMIGCIAMFLAGQMVSGSGKFIAALFSFITMFFLLQISKKVPRLAEYNLGIAMLVGILTAQFFVQIGGM